VIIRVGHLYPDYLNIYADRGNIAVLAQRAAWRGHELHVDEIGMDDRIVPGGHDLYYVGGGQDREQLLVAENLALKAQPLIDAVHGGARSAAGTNCSDAVTRASTARRCPVSDCCRSRPSQASGG
jgi:CobQ-like glutamine amidotransferase family enzyme